MKNPDVYPLFSGNDLTVCTCMHAKLLQTPWIVGFSRQKCWSGLPFPAPEVFPSQVLTLCLLPWQVDSLPLQHWEALIRVPLCYWSTGHRATLKLGKGGAKRSQCENLSPTQNNKTLIFQNTILSYEHTLWLSWNHL